MTITPITFSDIQTSDLLYYDPDIAEYCFEFCQARNIDCLPSLQNSKEFYRKTETKFVRQDISPEMCLDFSEFIFNEDLIDKFKNNHLHFVFKNQGLSGVVHFSDYNKPEVGVYLFKLLSSYERSLRNLLTQYGFSNKDMLDYFIYKFNKEKKDTSKSIYEGKISQYEDNKSTKDLLPPFETFYLVDLISLIHYKKITKVNDRVNRLRNDIMHVHSLVNKEDINRNDYIFDFTSFEEFFKLVLILYHDHRKVCNLLAFKSTSR